MWGIKGKVRIDFKLKIRWIEKMIHPLIMGDKRESKNRFKI
jgi:hypothetical protein